MTQENISLFEVNENGEVLYTSSDDESEVLEDAGDSLFSTDEVGDLLDDQEDLSENLEDTQEDSSNVDLLPSGDSGVPVVLSEDVTAAILASTPAGGSIGSTTLDFFDRVVSGLPADYKYIAYRTSSDNSYDAVLYYGDDFDISDDLITFGDGSTQIYVERVSSSSYSAETKYVCSEISDVSVDFYQSGSVIFYTNAAVGYPILGGYEMRKDYGFFIVPALIGALAVVVLSKLMFRR